MSTNIPAASSLLRARGFAALFAALPNPARGTTTITGATPGSTLTIPDGLSRELLTATSDAKGTARLALPIGLPAGVYIMRRDRQVSRLAVEQRLPPYLFYTITKKQQPGAPQLSRKFCRFLGTSGCREESRVY
ncbi:hypothetical protein GCM10027511_02910 [Hymenobacter humi]